jgi:hypothetical protein
MIYTEPGKIIRNMFDSIRAHCVNHSNGCEVLLGFKDYLEHVTNCQYKVVKCVEFAQC